MSAKQIGIKEKEQNRRNSVAGMISSEVTEAVAEQNQSVNSDDNILQENVDEAETIDSLKRQLEEAKAALKVQSTRKTRIKNTRVNLLMYKDVYEGLKEKCKKENVSVNDCMNQLAEKWIRE